MKFIKIIVLLLIVQSYAIAQTTTASFLRIKPGARAAGMGESYVAIADDVYATYWNPAGLSQLNRPEIGAMYNKWGEDEGQGYISYSHPLSKDNALGIFADYYEFGAGQQADEEGNIISWSSSPDIAFGASYSHRILPNLHLGVGSKYIIHKLIEKSGKGFAFDIGFLLEEVFLPNLNCGFAIQNFGPKLKFDSGREYDLPTDYRLGLSYKFRDINLITAFDIVKPIERDLYYAIGAEYNPFHNILLLRAGYNTNIQKSGLGLTVGLGFSLPDMDYLKFDYAFVPYREELGVTHRISATMRFSDELKIAQAERGTIFSTFGNCKNIYASADEIISGEPSKEPIMLAYASPSEGELVFRGESVFKGISGEADSKPTIEEAKIENCHIDEKAKISVPVKDDDGVSEVYILIQAPGDKEKKEVRMQGPDENKSGTWIYEKYFSGKGEIIFSFAAIDTKGNKQVSGNYTVKIEHLKKIEKPSPGWNILLNIVTFPVSIVEDTLWLTGKIISLPFEVF